MQKDRIKWNANYRDREYPTEPSDIVTEFYSLAPLGRALDIAAGTGRNAFFLARQGFTVDAVDISDVALRRLSDRHPNINPICADFDDFVIPKERYSLIININFLDRNLIPDICDGLVQGGMLIFETLRVDNEKKTGGPHDKDHLLRENELLRLFFSLRIIYYQESQRVSMKHQDPIASLVAFKT